MGSGKTTVCNFLKDQWGDKVKHINFKDALIKEMKETMPKVLDELAFVYDCTIDELFIKKQPVMRALLQNYGTELRRREDENYWVKRWHEAVEEAVNAGHHVVTDDVRFLNEAQAVGRFYDSKLIKLQRTDVRDTGVHQSEIEMDLISPDIVITSSFGDEEYVFGLVWQTVTQGD